MAPTPTPTPKKTRGKGKKPMPLFYGVTAVKVMPPRKRRGPIDQLRWVQEVMAEAYLRMPHLRPAGWHPDPTILPELAEIFRRTFGDP